LVAARSIVLDPTPIAQTACGKSAPPFCQKP
jgi:hypothetical protein